MKIRLNDTLAPRGQEMLTALAERRGAALAENALALMTLSEMFGYLLKRADIDPLEETSTYVTLQTVLPSCLAVLTMALGIAREDLALVDKAMHIDLPPEER